MLQPLLTPQALAALLRSLQVPAHFTGQLVISVQIRDGVPEPAARVRTEMEVSRC